MFAHSAISYGMERRGGAAFSGTFQDVTRECSRSGLISPKLYADPIPVKANARSHHLTPSDATVAEFRARTVEAHVLFVLRGCETGQDTRSASG